MSWIEGLDQTEDQKAEGSFVVGSPVEVVVGWSKCTPQERLHLGYFLSLQEGHPLGEERLNLGDLPLEGLVVHVVIAEESDIG